MSLSLTLQSNRLAAVDRLREEQAGALTQVLSVTAFVLLTAACAQIRIYLWEVPISLQTAAVYASGLYLGWWNGMLAQILYLALGLFLPVFAGEGTGLMYVLGAASGGYLLAYPAAAALVGYLSRSWKSLSGAGLSAIAGAAVIFTVGVIWLHYVAGHATWMESIDRGFLRFIAIDAAKIMFVSFIYASSRRVG